MNCKFFGHLRKFSMHSQLDSQRSGNCHCFQVFIRHRNPETIATFEQNFAKITNSPFFLPIVFIHFQLLGYHEPISVQHRRSVGSFKQLAHVPNKKEK